MQQQHEKRENRVSNSKSRTHTVQAKEVSREGREAENPLTSWWWLSGRWGTENVLRKNYIKQHAQVASQKKGSLCREKHDEEIPFKLTGDIFEYTYLSYHYI